VVLDVVQIVVGEVGASEQLVSNLIEPLVYSRRTGVVGDRVVARGRKDFLVDRGRGPLASRSLTHLVLKDQQLRVRRPNPSSSDERRRADLVERRGRGAVVSRRAESSTVS
jgi:hypothetical protein